MEELHQAIKAYLDEYATKDATFAVKYSKGDKTVEGCVRYITSELEKAAREERGSKMVICMAPSREKVYGMAVHYFDEDSIKECKEEPETKVAVAAPSTTTNPVAPKKTGKKTADKGSDKGSDKKEKKTADTASAQSGELLQGQLSLF